MESKESNYQSKMSNKQLAFSSLAYLAILCRTITNITIAKITILFVGLLYVGAIGRIRDEFEVRTMRTHVWEIYFVDCSDHDNIVIVLNAGGWFFEKHYRIRSFYDFDIVIVHRTKRGWLGFDGFFRPLVVVGFVCCDGEIRSNAPRTILLIII